jgi:hypothetical protein
MDTRPRNDGALWTRDQLVLAFELYCRIPFQRTKATDGRVRELAALIGRTPASVARKLGNLGAFDPQLTQHNISGLAHGSKLDKTVWDEFHQDWAALATTAQEIKKILGAGTGAYAAGMAPHIQPQGPSEQLRTAKQRLHQAFFRDAVLSSYNNRCCITGMSVVECLVASHIIPWSVDEHRRADPRNGVCISGTFDRLFDAGLITIQDDLTLRISGRFQKLKDKYVIEQIVARDGQKIIPPARFFPDPVGLRWHREHKFKPL